jgi:hypothetical protein
MSRNVGGMGMKNKGVSVNLSLGFLSLLTIN